MDLKIEKNIPMPKSGLTLLKSMEVGDSVVCSRSQYYLLRTSANNSQRRSPNNSQSVKVSARQLEDGSYRVWRVK